MIKRSWNQLIQITLSLTLTVPVLPAHMARAEEPHVQAQPQGVDASNLGEFNRTIENLKAFVQRGAKVSTVEKLQTRAQVLITKLMGDLAKDWDRIEAQKSADPEVLKLQKSEVMAQVQEIYEKAGQVGIAIPSVRRLDPTQPATPDNLAFVDMGLDLNSNFGFDQNGKNDFLTIQDQRSLMKKLGTKAFAAGKELGVQTLYFQIAQGLFAAALVGTAYNENPMAWDEFLKGATSPDGAVSLGAFIASNHVAARMLNGIRSGALPKTMIPYMSMAAATLASGLVMDMWLDQDLKACVWSKFISRSNGVNEAACDKATRSWMLSGKIMQYAPMITSMLASVALSSATTRVTLGAGKGVASLAGRRIKLILKGARIFRKGTAAAAALGELTPWGGAVAVGNLLIFFVWDHVVSEPLNDNLSSFTLANFDIEAWMDRRGGHFEFKHRKDFSQQPIANAFDVMATNLQGTDLYFNKLLEAIDSGYEALTRPLEKCVPESIKNLNFSGPVNASIYHTDYLAPDWYEWLVAPIEDFAFVDGEQNVKRRVRTKLNEVLKKSDSQLECEVMAQPLELLTRYNEIHQAWRQNILGRFTRRFDQWQKLVSAYNDVNSAAMKMGQALSSLRFSHQDKVLENPNAITHDGMVAALGVTPAPESTPSHPAYFDQVRTDDITDFVIASFACGPKTMGASTSLLTPFGSSLAFQPPKLTQGDGSICQALMQKKGGRDPRKFSPREGPWKDEKGLTYPSLYHYVYGQLDPAIWKGDRWEGFSFWWKDNVSGPISGVWVNYQKSFNDLVAKELAPVLFSRTYRTGCKAGPSPKGPADADFHPDNFDNEEGFVNESEDRSTLKTRRHNYEIGIFGGLKQGTSAKGQIYKIVQGEMLCQDSVAEYKVANGVILSIELEVRQYLRGLKHILKASAPGSDDAAYLQMANDLLLQIKDLSRMVDGLSSEEFQTQLNDISQSQETLASYVTEKLQIPESQETLTKESMGRALALKMLQNLRSSLSEFSNYAAWTTIMNFSTAEGARKAAPAQLDRKSVLAS